MELTKRLSTTMSDSSEASASRSASPAPSPPQKGGFEAPSGYTRATLAQERAQDEELWVLRLPDGVDAAALDGCTLPLSALQSTKGEPVASVTTGSNEVYDMYSTAVRRKDVPVDDAQLIEMAGAEQDNVFVERDFYATMHGVGIASDLAGIVPLVPTSENTLKMGTSHDLRSATQSASAPGPGPARPQQHPHSRPPRARTSAAHTALGPFAGEIVRIATYAASRWAPEPYRPRTTPGA